MGLDANLVRLQLGRLAGLPGARHSYAIESHGYRLRPTVDEAMLARAERAIGAPLPDEYRNFLTTLGDGGAGPYYGVMPLSDSLDLLEERFGSFDPLGRDCPLMDDIHFGDLTGQPDSWEEHVARLDSDPEYEAHYERLREEYFDRPWIDGRLPIVEIGCGDWLFLIVRGPRRGTVWVDSVDGSTGLYCLEVDFSTLYQRWLDESLAEAEDRLDPPRAHFSSLRYGNNPRYRPT